MDFKTYKLTITLETELLGSQTTQSVASEYLAKRNGFEALPEDEIETLPDALDKGTTVFHRLEDGTPVLFDYQVKGFIKEAGRTFNGRVSGKVKNLRSKVDSLVFVSPRQIRLEMPAGEEMDYLERPLRAETALGPRVALARSEMAPAGTVLRCGLTVLPCEITEEVLRELLDYGYFKGLGQWRNGGWGRFRYELVAED